MSVLCSLVDEDGHFLHAIYADGLQLTSEKAFCISGSYLEMKLLLDFLSVAYDCELSIFIF